MRTTPAGNSGRRETPHGEAGGGSRPPRGKRAQWSVNQPLTLHAVYRLIF